MTPSPTGTIEHTAEGGGRVHFERHLPFPVEEVWAALTEPARLADWWPPMAADITVDMREGGHITFDWPDTDFPSMVFTITEVQAPTVLQYSQADQGSWTRWELEHVDEGTRLLTTSFMPDLNMSIQRGDVVGLHYSLDRLLPALKGTPVCWDNDGFQRLMTTYAGLDSTNQQPV